MNVASRINGSARAYSGRALRFIARWRSSCHRKTLRDNRSHTILQGAFKLTESLRAHTLGRARARERQMQWWRPHASMRTRSSSSNASATSDSDSSDDAQGAVAEMLLRASAIDAGLSQVALEDVFVDRVAALRTHFVSGTLHGTGVMRCSYWIDESQQRAWLIAHLSLGAGNMAQTAHGGAMATLLDQGCGILFSSSHRGATAFLNVQYTAPVPLPAAVVVKAQLVRKEGRKVFINAQLERLMWQTVVQRQQLGGADDLLAGGVSTQALQSCASAESLFIASRPGD